MPTAQAPAPQLDFADRLTGPGRVVLRAATTTIGRLEDNGLRLQSPAVSKRHATIAFEDGRYVLRDLGSRNGTFVNGERLGDQAHTLIHGDWVTFGGENGPEARFLVDDPTRETSDASDVLSLAPVFVTALRALRPGHGLTEVLTVVLDSGLALSGAERGFIMLADRSGELTFRLARSSHRMTLPAEAFETTSRQIPKRVLQSGEGFFAPDLLLTSEAATHARTVRIGVRSVVCLPLLAPAFSDDPDQAASETRIGVLYLDSKEPGRLLSASTQAVLETLSAEAGVALENAMLYRERLEKQRLEEELARAAEIQRALLPSYQSAGSYFELAGSMEPCRAIGGDFFDYAEKAGAFHIMLGDVAGKGTEAALQAAVLQGIFAANVERTEGPAASVATINNVLCKRAAPGRLATLFYAVLSPDGRLTYCNAGHCPPIAVSDDGVERLDVGGLPVGVFPRAVYEEGHVDLRPGSSVLVYTDGVTETGLEGNPEAEQFGVKRLIAAAADTPARDPGALLARVSADLRTFASGAPPHDDVTMVAVRFLGRPVV